MGIAENIKRLRESHDMTQEELAKAVGMSRPAVTQWETGWSQPRMGTIEKLAVFFGVPKSEIIDGPHTASNAMPPNALLPEDEPRRAYAPLLGRVHAGDAQEPLVVDERVPIPYEVWEHHRSGYFLEVEGSCMSRVYPEGCHILVDPSQPPQNGSVAVVSIDGEDYVMRRLYRTPQTVVLSPDSWDEGYEDIVITAGDERTVEYVGTVVWFQPAEEME